MTKNCRINIEFKYVSEKEGFEVQLTYENVTAQMAWEGIKVYLSSMEDIAKKTLSETETQLVQNCVSAIRLVLLGADTCLKVHAAKQSGQGSCSI